MRHIICALHVFHVWLIVETIFLVERVFLRELLDKKNDAKCEETIANLSEDEEGITSRRVHDKKKWTFSKLNPFHCLNN